MSTISTTYGGGTEYRLYGKRHRVDGPAIIHTDGTQEWYLNGKFHRVDGPAIIWADGTQEWHLDGEYHRVDGPAIIRTDGSQQWYLDGKFHRVDGPAIIRPDGTEYRLNGNLHRVDGPAVIRSDGTQVWYLDGKRHRVDGPAIIRVDGTCEFWIGDIRIIKPREILPLRPENHSNCGDVDEPCGICREAIWLPAKVVQSYEGRDYVNMYCEECIASWFATGSKVNPGTNVVMDSPEFVRMWRIDEGGNVVDI
jgi:hypothetical protein